MTVARLILLELAAAPAAVLLIHAVLRHACDPRRDGGRHRPGRHRGDPPLLITIALYPAYTGGTR